MCDKVLQNLQYSQGSYEAPVLHEVYTSGNPASRVSFDLPRSVGKRKETLWASSTFFEFRRKWFLGCCVCQSSSKISLLQENGLNSRVTFLDWKRSGWLKSFSVLQSPGWSFLIKEFRFVVLWLQVRFEFLTHAQHKMLSQLGESPSSSRLVYKDRRRLCSQGNKWYPRRAFSFCPHDGQARLRPRHFPTFKAYLQSTCLFVVVTV